MTTLQPASAPARTDLRFSPRSRGSFSWWANLALINTILAAAALAAAAIARHDLSVIDNSMSYYAVGPWWFLQSAAFLALGGASLTLGLALFPAGSRNSWLTVAGGALVLSGAASLGLVVFPMGMPAPATFLGDAHQTAGTIAGIAQLVAALAFLLASRTIRGWERLARPAAAAFGLALLGAVLTQIEIWWPRLGIPMGAAMRLVVIPLMLLWGMVAWRLRRESAGAANLSSAVR